MTRSRARKGRPTRDRSAMVRNRPKPAQPGPEPGRARQIRDRPGKSHAQPTGLATPGQIRTKHDKSELAVAGRTWTSHSKRPVGTKAQQKLNTVSGARQIAKQSQKHSELELGQSRGSSLGQARASPCKPELGPPLRKTRTGQVNVRT